MSAYAKGYDGQINGCMFCLKLKTHWKLIILFGIKSALILKKNFIANLSITKSLNTKVKSYCDQATNLHDKEILEYLGKGKDIRHITDDFQSCSDSEESDEE